MALEKLPFELWQLIADYLLINIAQSPYCPWNNDQRLNALFKVSVTCRVLWGNISGRMYRFDAEHRGSSALVWAAAHNDEPVAKRSLAQGANVHATNKHGQFPLWLAARAGHIEMVKLLLDHGAHIEAKPPTGLTPIAIAARENQHGVIDLLLRRGANIETESREHSTPLLWAIRSGAQHAAKTLLDHGANLPEPYTKLYRRWGLTAYRAGPKRWTEIPEIRTMIASRRHHSNQDDDLVIQPLRHALQHQFLAMSMFILDKCTPFVIPHDNHRAQTYNIRKIFGPPVVGHPLGQPLEHALWWAVFHGEEEIVGKLLKLRVGRNFMREFVEVSKNPNRPLDLALDRGFPGIAELLLQHDADPNYWIWHRQSPLTRAVKMENMRLVTSMLGHNAITTTEDWEPRPALFIAVAKQDVAMVRLLARQGCDPRSRACLLRRRYASPDISIWEYADQKGNQEVLDALEEFKPVPRVYWRQDKKWTPIRNNWDTDDDHYDSDEETMSDDREGFEEDAYDLMVDWKSWLFGVKARKLK